jgi:hypothetical protein
MLYHYHPDGFICLRDGSTDVYVDTVANFNVDFGAPPPALPAGMIECVYDQAERHVYADARQNAFPVEGKPASAPHEAVIAAASKLTKAKSARAATAQKALQDTWNARDAASQKTAAAQKAALDAALATPNAGAVAAAASAKPATPVAPKGGTILK